MAVSARIQQVYLALFGRPADPVGGAYYDGITHNGADLNGILSGPARLSGSPEYTSRFTGLTDTQIINTIFQSLFAHNADLDTLNFYTAALQNGRDVANGLPPSHPTYNGHAVPSLTIDQIAVGILDGATGSDAAIVANKVEAAMEFTAALDTPDEIAAYAGDAAADYGRAFLSGVTADHGTVPTAQQTADAVQNLVNDAHNGLDITLTNVVESIDTTSSPQHTSSANDTIHGVISGTSSQRTANTGDHVDGGDGYDRADLLVTSNTTTVLSLNSVEEVDAQLVNSDANLNGVNWNGTWSAGLHDSTSNTMFLTGLKGEMHTFDFFNNLGNGAHTIDATYQNNALGKDASIFFYANTDSNAVVNLHTSGTDTISKLVFENDTAGTSANAALTVNGAGPVTEIDANGVGGLGLKVQDTSKVATFDASGNSGGVTINLAGSNVALKATGSSGSDDLTINLDHTNVANLGKGDDLLRITDVSLKGMLDGGDGTDTLYFLNANDATTASADSKFAATINSFESIEIGNVSKGSNVDVNLKNLDNATTVITNGSSAGDPSEVKTFTIGSGTDASGGLLKIGATTLDLAGSQSVAQVANAINAAHATFLSDNPLYQDISANPITGLVTITYKVSAGDIPANGPSAQVQEPSNSAGVTFGGVVQNDGKAPVQETQTFTIDSGSDQDGGKIKIGNTSISIDGNASNDEIGAAIKAASSAIISGNTNVSSVDYDANTNTVTIKYNASAGDVGNITVNPNDGADTKIKFGAVNEAAKGDAGKAETQTFTVSGSDSDGGNIVVGGVVIKLGANLTADQVGAAILNHTGDITSASGGAIAGLAFDSATDKVTVTYNLSAGNAPAISVGNDNTDTGINLTGLNNQGGKFYATVQTNGVNGGQPGGDLTIDNLASGGTVVVNSALNGDTHVNVVNANTGTADALTLSYSGSDGFHSNGVLFAPGVEAITILTNATGTNPGSNFGQALEGGATSVMVKGNAGFDFTVNGGSDLSHVATFDASGVSGKGGLGSVVAFGIGDAVTGGATITGGAGDDFLGGGQHNDTITGGGGDDTYFGAGGADVFNLGSGTDAVVFNSSTDSFGTTVDTINNFTSKTDKLDFNIGGPAVTFTGNAAGLIAAQTALHHTVNEAVFDTVSHQVYVDVNGDGVIAGGDMVITLTGVASLDASDFV